MIERYQGCKIREISTLELFRKLYWHPYKKFILLGTIACSPILLIVIPVYFSAGALGALALITLLLAILSLIAIGFSLYYLACFLSGRAQHKTWILEKNGKLIATAFFQPQHQYSHLVSINVVNGFQNQGYGSYLVRWLCQNMPKPIYVYPVFGLADFYTKLGFSSPKVEQLPESLRADLKAVKKYKIMMYE